MKIYYSTKKWLEKIKYLCWEKIKHNIFAYQTRMKENYAFGKRKRKTRLGLGWMLGVLDSATTLTRPARALRPQKFPNPPPVSAASPYPHCRAPPNPPRIPRIRSALVGIARLRSSDPPRQWSPASRRSVTRSRAVAGSTEVISSLRTGLIQGYVGTNPKSPGNFGAIH